MVSSIGKIYIEPLQGTKNYIEWSLKLKALLTKDSIVDAIQKATKDDNNRQAVANIRLFCAQGPLLYIKDEDIAYKAWNTLERLYNPKGFTTEYLSLKELFNTSSADFSTIEEYLNKVKYLVEDLASKGILLPDQVVIAWVLNSLGESYKSFIQTITQSLRKDPKSYTIDSLFASLIDEARGHQSTQEDIYLNIHQRHSLPSLSRQTRSTRPTRLTKQFSKQDRSKIGKSSYKRRPLDGPFCGHCLKATHNTANCWYLYPEKRPLNWQPRQRPMNQVRPTATTNWPKSEYSLEAQQKQKAMIATILESDMTSNSSQNTSQATSQATSQDTSQDISLPSLADSQYESGLPSYLGKTQYIEASSPINTIESDFDIDMKTPEVYITQLPLAAQYTNTIYSIFDKDNTKSYIKPDEIAKLLSNESILSDIEFVIDTAATVSVINKLEYFYNYWPTNKTVIWGKAKSVQISYQGNVILRTNSYIYILKNVLYMPELGINILSTNCLEDMVSTFYKDRAYIYTKDIYTNRDIYSISPTSNISSRTTIFTAIKQAGLYKANLDILCPKGLERNLAILAIQTEQEAKKLATIKLWHERLAHIGLNPLQKILKQLDINISQQDISSYIDDICQTCLLSKYNRAINKRSYDNTEYQIGERIHSDLGGPISPKTYNGYSYYITFLDKKSRYLDVRLMISKDQALSMLKVYKDLSENQTQNTIKEIFTDNGKEYINNEFAIYIRKYGIIHRNTPIYTKEPNGLIERINLTLLNKLRSLLIYAKVNQNLWGEALLAAVYLYNRTPHRSLEFKTPYEIYKGKTPAINHIRIWGSIAYYHTNKHLAKLEPRKNLAILVGYSDYMHYKLYDIKLRRTIWTRDAVILEGKFLDTHQKDIYQDTTKTRPIDLDPTRAISRSIEPTRPILRSLVKSQAIKQALIDASPNHKIEVQIPKPSLYHIDKAYIYSIDQTTIADQLKKLYNSEIDYILSASAISEPNSFEEAMNSDEKDLWYQACLDENNELLAQNTYKIIDIPPYITPIKGRWVFKKKPIKNPTTIKPNYITNSDKTIRYKARWVIQGFYQKLGIDFLETFSTTARTETWHLLLIIAVNKGWPIIQFDVKNAFVHADIDTDIYTILPKGLYNNPIYANKCCYLKKALYGLKQAPRLWNLYFRKVAKGLGFDILPYDEGVYINKLSKAILIVHVDDILFIHQDKAYIQDIAKKFNIYIKLEELGDISTFLGNNIYIDYLAKQIYIDQKDYIYKLLDKFNISQYRPIKIPGEPGIRLNKNPNISDKQITSQYQQQIGSLLYASLKTRLDITFAVNYCARYMSNPGQEHIKALEKIWRYLLYRPNLGLLYNCCGDNLYIKGYSDADWAGDLDSRRSTTGYIFSLSGDIGLNNPISWNSQLQKSVALSSCEAEYMAIKEAIKEAIYLANIFNYINTQLDLGYIYNIPIILVDNESAIKLGQNPEFHKRTKHIDIQYHYIREAIQDNKVKLTYINTKRQLADLLTKNVNRILFEEFTKLANLVDINISTKKNS